MYVDPSGEFFVLSCIIVGAFIGGVTAYNYGKNAGYEGTDLILLTILGSVAGGIVGYLAVPYVGSFLQTTFTLGPPTFTMSGGTLAIGLTSVTVTGTQITVIGGTMATSVYMFANDGRPKRNKSQNKQFRDLMNKYDINDPDLRTAIHRELQSQPPMNYKELEKFIKWLLGLN